MKMHLCSRNSTNVNLMTGSRRLITYRRIPDSEVSAADMEKYNAREGIKSIGTTANELNPFRRGYFNKFQAEGEE